MIALALLAPLSVSLLHLVAWDLDRWNSLLVTASFLVFCAAYSVAREKWVPMPMGRLVAVILLLIFLNAVSDIRLLDSYTISQFPFVEQQEYLRDVLPGKTKFLPKLNH